MRLPRLLLLAPSPASAPLVWTPPVLAALVACVGCGEAAEPDPAGCGCPGEVCAEGQCVLKVVVNDDCWGQARVFVGDVSTDAVPAGTAALGAPFVACDPFKAPVSDAQGQIVQQAEPFVFIVESEDGRALAGSLNGQTFTCAGSAPFVFSVDLCQ